MRLQTNTTCSDTCIHMLYIRVVTGISVLTENFAFGSEMSKETKN